MFRITRSTVRQAWASAALIALVTAPAGAQTYSTTFGVTGGWSTAGDLTPGLSSETVFEDGWTAGAQLESWAGRFGMRLNVGYAARSLEGTTRSFQIAAADAGLMVRLLAPARDRVVAPFIGVGAGPIMYRADNDGSPIGDGAYGDDPVIRLMLAPSAGVDLFTRSSVGLRIEVADRMVLPSIGLSPESEGLPRVHNPGIRGVLQFRFGRPAPRLAGTPAPAEPGVRSEPEPRVEPEPGVEPEPRVEPEPEPRVEPEPRTPESTRAPTLPAAPGTALYTIRVGALWDWAPAREWERRLEPHRLPVWVTQVDVGGQRMARLRIGAVDSPDDARTLATRLEQELGYETRVDTVAAGEAVPADAIVATLRFLLGQ